jgi:electron transfer flavoprotein beta subunit
MRVAVALSCGVDSLSGRAAPVLSEIHAIGLARQLSADLVGVHVGAQTSLLRDYAAYGLNRIDVLSRDEAGTADVGTILAAWLRANADISILVTGHKASGALDSGLVPFEVAHALGWAVVSDVAAVVSVSQQDGGSPGTMQALQARPRGVRRPVFIDGPCVLAAHERTGTVPTYVHAVGRAAQIEGVHLGMVVERLEPEGPEGEIRPWRARPRLMNGAADTARQGSANVLVAPSPDEAARAIIDHLRQLGLGPSGSASRNVTQ